MKFRVYLPTSLETSKKLAIFSIVLFLYFRYAANVKLKFVLF